MKDGMESSDYRVQDLESDKMQISDLPAEVNVSGGMWAIGSSPSGTSMSTVIKAGSFGQGTPLGVVVNDASSGNDVTVQTRGLYKGLVAEDTVNVGDAVRPGVGGGMNTVVSIGSDAAQYDAGDTKGVCVMGGASGDTVGVFLW